MDFKDYLYIIRKRWYIFILVLATVFGIHHFYVMKQRPIYRGTSRVTISAENYSPLASQGSMYPYNQVMSWYRRHSTANSLTSHNVLDMAGKILACGNGRIEGLMDPAVNEYVDMRWHKDFCNSKSYLRLSDEAMAKAKMMIEDSKKKKKPITNTVKDLKFELLAERFARMLRGRILIKSEKTEMGQPTGIIGITYQNMDNSWVIAVTNAVAYGAKIYHDRESEKVVKEVLKSTKEEMKNAEIKYGDLLEKKEKLRQSKHRHADGFIFPINRGYNLIFSMLAKEHFKHDNKLVQIKSEIERKNRELREMQDRLAQKEQKYRQDLGRGLINTAETSELRRKITNLELKKKALQGPPSIRTDEHPTVKMVIDQIKIVKKELDTALERAMANKHNENLRDLETVNRQIGLLIEQQGNLDALKARKLEEMKNLNSLQVTLELMERDISRTLAKITRLEDYRLTLKIREAAIEPAVKVYEPCRTAVTLLKRGEKMQDYVLTAILALITAVFLVYFLEYVDTRIATEYDIRRHLNLPVLGVIPELRAPNVLLTTASPTSEMAERLNTAGTVLKSIMQEQGQKSILICSAKPQEGKTTMAVNLSIALARKGMNVILADTDMRKPRIHTILNLPNAVGLSTLLEGKFEAKQIVDNILGDSTAEAYNFRDYLLPTEFPNLRVLPSGPVPANPVEFLESNNMKLIVERLKREGDIVIFDSPPMNTVGDGLALAGILDTCVVVIGSRQVEQSEATWMKHMLSSTQATIAGAILNRSRVHVRNEYYYYYNKDRKKVRRSP